MFGDFGLTFWSRVHNCWLSDGELNDELGYGKGIEAKSEAMSLETDGSEIPRGPLVV